MINYTVEYKSTANGDGTVVVSFDSQPVFQDISQEVAQQLGFTPDSIGSVVEID